MEPLHEEWDRIHKLSEQTDDLGILAKLLRHLSDRLDAIDEYEAEQREFEEQ